MLLRTSATSWPSGTEVFGGLFAPLRNTVILILATVNCLAAKKSQRSTWSMLQSTIWAMLFLLFKIIEYKTDAARNLVPSSSTFLAVYFVLTGLHALHVAGGVVANLWVWRGSSRVGQALTIGRINALAVYWTFVDIIWLIILVLFYLT